MSVAVTVAPSQADQEWFASWFDSPHYHRLYAHRDEIEASRFIDRLIRRLEPMAGAAMLDLGCGSGRHSRQLSARGFSVTGLDLSAQSLARARSAKGPAVRYVEQDMRQPFGYGRFAYVFSLFTSFGYFDNPADHFVVANNIAAALKPGGTVVLDYLNVERTRRDLVPSECFVRDGVTYSITRWIDRAQIIKQIVIEELGRAPMTHVERVAVLGLEHFRLLFAACGLRIDAVYGDYDLGAFDPASSPRLILVGSAAPSRDRTLATRQVPANPAERLRRHAQV